MLFDSHAHFNNDDFTTEQRDELLTSTNQAVKDGCMCLCMDIGFDAASSAVAAAHAAEYPWCYAAVGCHPHDTNSMNDEKLAQIRELAAQEKVMAIGEIGLDFYYDRSERDIQREWFRRQLQLCNELRMPVVIHSRSAVQETMEILTEEGAFSEERKSWFPARPDETGFVKGDGEPAEVPDARVLIHCFSGSAETAREYIKLGATISIAGPVTFKNNRKTVEVVEMVPMDFLLVETDSPYLAPVPYRGRTNMPPYVEYTARKVAEIKGLSFEEVAAKTCENAKRFYGIM